MPHNIALADGILEILQLRRGWTHELHASKHKIRRAVCVQLHQPGVRGVDEAIRHLQRTHGAGSGNGAREVLVEVDVDNIVDVSNNGADAVVADICSTEHR